MFSNAGEMDKGSFLENGIPARSDCSDILGAKLLTGRGTRKQVGAWPSTDRHEGDEQSRAVVQRGRLVVRSWQQYGGVQPPPLALRDPALRAQTDDRARGR